MKKDPLDWNGDHIHTNFRDFYHYLRNHGYFIEVLGSPFTCFDAGQYGTLLIVDPEEEFFTEEVIKLKSDFDTKGLSVIIFADWYNATVMEKVRFFDESTRRWWEPETGGSNIPALNDLLTPFDIALSDQVFEGDFKLAGHDMYYASGTSILKFPRDGTIIPASILNDQGKEVIEGVSSKVNNVPILGLYHPSSSSSLSSSLSSVQSPLSSVQSPSSSVQLGSERGRLKEKKMKVPEGGSERGGQGGGGRLAIFGDSNCLDSSHMVKDCFWMMNELLKFTATGSISKQLLSSSTSFSTSGSISKQLLSSSTSFSTSASEHEPKNIQDNQIVDSRKSLEEGKNARTRGKGEEKSSRTEGNNSERSSKAEGGSSKTDEKSSRTEGLTFPTHHESFPVRVAGKLHRFSKVLESTLGSSTSEKFRPLPECIKLVYEPPVPLNITGPGDFSHHQQLLSMDMDDLEISRMLKVSGDTFMPGRNDEEMVQEEEEGSLFKFLPRLPSIFFQSNSDSINGDSINSDSINNEGSSFMNVTTCFLLILVFLLILYFKKRIKKKVTRRWNRSKRLLLRYKHSFMKYFNRPSSSGSNGSGSNGNDPFKFVNIHSGRPLITSGCDEDQVVLDESDHSSSDTDDDWDDLDSDELDLDHPLPPSSHHHPLPPSSHHHPLEHHHDKDEEEMMMDEVKSSSTTVDHQSGRGGKILASSSRLSSLTFGGRKKKGGSSSIHDSSRTLDSSMTASKVP